jgi:antitoxin PrlF
VYLHYQNSIAFEEGFMASQAVTAKGQITLKRELLQHLGVKPGERIDFDKLPGGELRLRAARPTGTIDDFLGVLDGKVDLKEPLSIEDMNRVAAAGWAGELDKT